MCGDGRILIAAVQHGAHAVGFELAWWPYLLARLNVYFFGQGRAQVHRRDFFEADLSDATHILVFQLPGPLQAMMKKIRREVRQECVVVSYRFAIEGNERGNPVGQEGLFKVIVRPDDDQETAWESGSRLMPSGRISRRSEAISSSMESDAIR